MEGGREEGGRKVEMKRGRLGGRKVVMEGRR